MTLRDQRGRAAASPMTHVRWPHELWEQADREHPDNPEARRRRYHELLIEAGHLRRVDDFLAPDECCDDDRIAWEQVETLRRFLGGRTLDPAYLRATVLDDEPAIYGRCPGCGEWALLDDDQLHGVVSTHHDPGCGWHQVKNWWTDHSTRAFWLARRWDSAGSVTSDDDTTPCPRCGRPRPGHSAFLTCSQCGLHDDDRWRYEDDQ